MTTPPVTRWSTAASLMLLAGSVMITGAVLRRELQLSRSVTDEPRTIAGWRSLMEGGHVIGSPHARVKVIEFSDFQCPFCAELKPALRRVLQVHASDVAIQYRHFPNRALASLRSRRCKCIRVRCGTG